jgi:hypothetical protein
LEKQIPASDSYAMGRMKLGNSHRCTAASTHTNQLLAMT